MAKSFLEVMRSIQPGETYKCTQKNYLLQKIIYSDSGIHFEMAHAHALTIFGVPSETEKVFELEIEKVSFDEAIHYLHEGAKIKSLATHHWYYLDGDMLYRSVTSDKKSPCMFYHEVPSIMLDEIMDKWVIDNADNI